VEHATRLGSPRLLSLAHLVSAQTARSLEPERANAAFQLARQSADTAGTPFERACILEVQAEYLRATGSNLEAAASMTADALTIREALRAGRGDMPPGQNGVLIRATA
jgi:hypothetical protein